MKSQVNLVKAAVDVCERVPLVGYSLMAVIWLLGATIPLSDLSPVAVFFACLGSLAAGGAVSRFLYLRVESDQRWLRASPALTALFGVLTHAVLLFSQNFELGHAITKVILAFDGLVALIALVLILGCEDTKHETPITP